MSDDAAELESDSEEDRPLVITNATRARRTEDPEEQGFLTNPANTTTQKQMHVLAVFGQGNEGAEVWLGVRCNKVSQARNQSARWVNLQFLEVCAYPPDLII